MASERFKFSDEHIDFIRLHWDKKPSVLVKLFHQKFGLLKHRQVLRKLKRRLGIPSLQHANRYSKAELEFAKNNRTLPIKMLSQKMEEEFGKPFPVHALRIMKIKKGWKTGRSGRYAKGDNTVPLYSERFERGSQQWLIKTGVRRWEKKSHYLWRKAHGSIPRTHCIWYKDGNSQNCTLENLEAISRTEMIWRHKLEYNKLDEQLKPTFEAFLKLRTGIIERKKQGNKMVKITST